MHYIPVHVGSVRVYDLPSKQLLCHSQYASGGSSLIWAPVAVDPSAMTIFAGFTDGVVRSAIEHRHIFKPGYNDHPAWMRVKVPAIERYLVGRSTVQCRGREFARLSQTVIRRWYTDFTVLVRKARKVYSLIRKCYHRRLTFDYVCFKFC